MPRVRQTALVFPPPSQRGVNKRKRTAPAGPYAGPGPALQRYRGPNVPPGLFFQQMPRVPHRKHRRDLGGVKRKRRYPRTGSGRISTRPQHGRVVSNEVHRNYRETPRVAWPRLAAMATAPSPAAIYVPHSYQFWSRGLSDRDFTGSKVTLKNISVMIQMSAPQTVLTTMNIPYRLRVTAGWCKQSARVKVYPTTDAAISGQYPNGMAINENQPSLTAPIPPNDGNFPAVLETVRNAIDDSVQISGVHQNEAAYPRNNFFIISDSVTNWAPTTSVDVTNPANSTQRTYTPKTLKFNFTSNKQLKLLGFTTQATNPPNAAAEWFSPCNEPGLWIPFVALQMLNHDLYDSAETDMPTLKFTENTFFLDN